MVGSKLFSGFQAEYTFSKKNSKVSGRLVLEENASNHVVYHKTQKLAPLRTRTLIFKIFQTFHFKYSFRPEKRRKHKNFPFQNNWIGYFSVIHFFRIRLSLVSVNSEVQKKLHCKVNVLSILITIYWHWLSSRKRRFRIFEMFNENEHYVFDHKVLWNKRVIFYLFNQTFLLSIRHFRHFAYIRMSINHQDENLRQYVNVSLPFQTKFNQQIRKIVTFSETWLARVHYKSAALILKESS